MKSILKLDLTTENEFNELFGLCKGVVVGGNEEGGDCWSRKPSVVKISLVDGRPLPEEGVDGVTCITAGGSKPTDGERTGLLGV